MPVNVISARCALQFPQLLPCKNVWTASDLMLINYMQHKCTACGVMRALAADPGQAGILLGFSLHQKV